jgi:phosphopantothenoylcysteine decarboxylase/phosphopantothenate--cysteine ligase
MGYAIALEAAQQGAKVMLVSGPTQLTISHPNISLYRVQSAQEMYEKVSELFPATDVAIFSAAVADFTPKIVHNQKIKEKQQSLHIELQPTVDIAKEIGKTKQAHQKIIGFALETHNEVEHALGKMQRKNFDCIVLNSLADTGAGFGYDTNKVTMLHKNGTINTYELKSKTDVAKDIIHVVTQLVTEK